MKRKELKEMLGSYFSDLCEELANPDDFKDVFCFRTESDPAHIYYLPLAILPEKNSLEQMQFTMLATGSSNVLQLASRWDIDRALLKKLNQELLKKLEPEKITFLDFSIPDVDVTEARLEIANENSGYDTLQSSISSGFFPFNTVFNVVIDPDQKASILHALHGTDNDLRIIYAVNIQVQTVIQAGLSGDVSEIPDLMHSGLDQTAIIEILENAVAEGVLILTYQGDQQEESRERITRSLYEMAADALKNYNKNSAVDRSTNGNSVRILEGSLVVRIEEKSGKQVLIEPEANVAEWFATLKTSLPEDPEKGKTVETTTGEAEKPATADVVFVAPSGIEDTTINFIKIANQAHSITLVPPDFAQQILRKGTGATLVTTSFTDGGEDFVTELPENFADKAQYPLSFDEVGLSEIVFDAESLAEKNATSARLHIQYRPSGGGTPDERTLFFKPGEWTGKWLVCSRAKDLDGELRYDIKVTEKDGKSTKYSGTSKSPHIQFKIEN